AFCVHGIKQAMLGETRTARRYFCRSIRTSPAYLASYLLLLLSLLGQRPLQFAIFKRRQLAGNSLGGEAGLAGILESPTKQEPPASNGIPLPNGHSDRNGSIAADMSKVKAVVVGQTPPPHHGQAIMIERLIKADLAGVELIHVRMNMSSAVKEI